MPLSPEDIESKRFMPDIRGYDRTEVDAFLGEVAAHYRDLERRLKDAQDALQRAGRDGDRFENLGEDVASVLRAATDEADRLKASAREEAAEVLAQAAAEARRLGEAA